MDIERILEGDFDLDYTLKPNLPDWVHKDEKELMSKVRGTPWAWMGRLARAGRTLVGYVPHNPIVKRRFRILKDKGFIDHIPNWSQMLVGATHQILGTASEETEEYYEKTLGVDFASHVKRRIISDPSTLMDPVGLLQPLQSLLNHLRQTIHRDPRFYDMALTHAYKNGPEIMRDQIYSWCDGTAPEQEMYEHLYEDRSYWYRLKYQVDQFMDDPHQEPPTPEFSHETTAIGKIAMHQFASVRGYTNYASRLDVRPRDVFALARNLLSTMREKEKVIKRYGKEEGKKVWSEIGPKFRIDTTLCDPHLQEKYGFK